MTNHKERRKKGKGMTVTVRVVPLGKHLWVSKGSLWWKRAVLRGGGGVIKQDDSVRKFQTGSW